METYCFVHVRKSKNVHINSSNISFHISYLNLSLSFTVFEMNRLLLTLSNI